MSSNPKPMIVWSLYAAGVAAVLTPFIGVVLAYVWRRETTAPATREHDRQVRLFWRAGLGWAVAFAFMGLALFLDIRGGVPAGADKPMLFSLGLLAGVLTQIWFTIMSVWHLFRTLRSGPSPLSPA